MINVYEQIDANKTRSNIIVAAFTGFIIFSAYLITKAFNLDNSLITGAVIFSSFSSLVSFFYGDQIVLSLNQAKLASRQEFFDYYTIVENLSLALQIPMPKIYIIRTNAMNAFATGRDPQHAVICVTTGLLEKLNRTELEGVIGHELSHIVNYDIRLMMIVSLLLGSFSLLVNNIYRFRFFGNQDRNRRSESSGVLVIIGFLMIIFAPIIAQLIQLALSRRREFLADASSVKITRQPQGLIDALKKINSDKQPFSQASPATTSLYINNPFQGKKILSLFSTHPPIEDRIRALETML